MGISIQNNAAALVSLNELSKNINGASKYLDRIAAGDKIIGAQDDAAAYAVSERLTLHLRSLAQDTQNVQNATALIKTAAGGVENILDELRNLRELAIESATDTNTDIDRQIIQKTFAQKTANINDIADSTSYNGKKILDGTFRGAYKIPVTKTVFTGSHEEIFITGSHEVETTTNISETVFEESVETVTRVIPTTVTLTKTYTETVESREPVELPADGKIDSDGVYEVANFRGDITISAKNVKLVGNGNLQNVYISATNSGANLWLENLKIINSSDKNVIKFFGGDNVLTVSGENILKVDGDFFGANISAAVINVGGGLTIQGTGGAALNVGMSGMASNSGALIGSDNSEQSSADIRIGSGVSITNSLGSISCYGAAIGSGYDDSSIGNIFIGNGADISLNRNWIGSGINSSAGNIFVGNGAKISMRDVLSSSANIGSGNEGAVGDIFISNSATILLGPTTVIGAGYRGSAGNVSYVDDLNLPVNVEIAEPVNLIETEMTSATTIETTTTITETNTVSRPIVSTSTVQTTTTVFDTKRVTVAEIETFSDTAVVAGSPVQFYFGTRAGDSVSVTINDMHAKTLGIDGVNLDTRENSNAAISVIDAAINYALDQATNIGAVLSRLELTRQNISTTSENLHAANSTIRNADMAREIIGYTKTNILASAAQSMLAQANQISGNVLTLIQ